MKTLQKVGYATPLVAAAGGAFLLATDSVPVLLVGIATAGTAAAHWIRKAGN